MMFTKSLSIGHLIIKGKHFTSAAFEGSWGLNEKQRACKYFHGK